MKIQTTVLVMLATATVVAAPLGTEFTYQGVLSDAGVPAAGVFDFRFLLYDADVGGSQVGGIIYVEDLTVAGGRMTTELDFGGVYDGTALWLEVGVRDGASTGSYTVLSPRQELTAAPFAQHAATADAATTAVSATTADHATTADSAATAEDADTLEGEHGSYYLTWSNFAGIPGDLADGDDDSLADLSCAPNEIARWNGSAWSCSSDDDTPYARTYVVGPVGTALQNGSALRNAVGAISEPSSREEAVLVVIEPGVYDLGSNFMVFWDWMTLEGAGEDSTFITSAVCDTGGTIYSLANHIGLRRVTVENTCSNPGATARAGYFSGVFATLENCTFKVEGAALIHIAIESSTTALKMSNVTIRAESGTDTNIGLANTGNEVVLSDVAVDAHGGSYMTKAIDNAGSDFTLRDGVLKISGSNPNCVGLKNSGDQFRIEDVAVTAPYGSGLGTARGIEINDASGVINNVYASAQDAIYLNKFIASPLRTVTIRGTQAQGFSRGIVCSSPDDSLLLAFYEGYASGLGVGVQNGTTPSRCDVFLGGSFVHPTVSGAATCLGVYTRSVFHTNTCP